MYVAFEVKYDGILLEERKSSFPTKYLQICKFPSIPSVLLFGSLNVDIFPTDQNNFEAATNGDQREKSNGLST